MVTCLRYSLAAKIFVINSVFLQKKNTLANCMRFSSLNYPKIRITPRNLSDISEQLLVLKLAFPPYFTMFQQTIYEFTAKKRSQILPPGADHGRKITVAGLPVSGFQRKFKMVREASHSTDFSLERRRSFNNFIGSLHSQAIIEDKVIQQHWLRRKIAQTCLKILLYFCCTICVFQHQTKKVFAFLSNLSATFVTKATFGCFLSKFLRDYRKLFGHSQYGQLTAVETGQPLTSITLPFRGLMCQLIKVT